VSKPPLLVSAGEVGGERGLQEEVLRERYASTIFFFVCVIEC